MPLSNKVISGRYQLTKLIGSGGMADVYVAHDSVLGRKVAIKVLNEELAANKKFSQRFKQEAKSASSMDHPNIVQVLDAGETTETDENGVKHTYAFLVMEYVDGLELSKLVARGPLKVPEAIRVTKELLSAVEFAHNKGIVHRDIKPDNIMLTRAGKVKVLDFGIARAVAETFDDIATTTSILGTAAYFSPEQAQGQKVDIRTDIYAIGIVLFEMLTGKIPFTGDTAVAVAHQHIHAHPPAPSSINPKVSLALDQVVFTALAKDKADRFQTTAEFGRELRLTEAAKATAPKAVKAQPVVENDVDSLLGSPISEPAAEKSDSISELPDDFLFLFGDDPQTAPTLIQPEQFRPERKRVITAVAVIALVFGAIAGVGLWVATLEPTNIFPSSTVTVPTLKNVAEKDAIKELQDLDLITSIVVENSALVKKGKVIRTEPEKGAVIDPGTPITVYVSAGKTMVEVPQVADMTVADAKVQLEAVGLVLGTTTESHSPSYAAGLVISTTPTLGTKLIQGSKVNVLVSDGKIEIPDLKGKTVTDANNLLSTLSITPTVQADTTCAKAEQPTVRSQSPAPGVVSQGTPVTITYCAG
ncbi:Stk1 family PASTA domain-containing Ser/Thr kinase [Aurantimicrobium photophilum]|uniref:non-specific serine/threonine protein kinase n=1 Tax=Aurantimicrobium photophilum TaxID=1987356 RepID=A0A2Z3S036_9MICO|nr:Stk1 family PASTA domain-containing Ser/Thr kinase [Aurantimicrobium photophilum]AWR22349.1 Serine/threonine-protein kinase PknB [Aurantimicrobium photophilum]